MGLSPLQVEAGKPVDRQVRNDVVTFSVIGDVPYGTSEISVFQQHVDDHDLYSPSDFLVHVGDILAGSESCNEARYQTVANILRSLAVPAFIVPGDNETTDCADPAQGWAYWVVHLLGIEDFFCGVPAVQRQPVRSENFAFVHKGVLFVGIHLVGGSNDTQLMQDDAAWVDAQLQAHVANVRAAVVFAQAGPGGNRDVFFDAFEVSAATFVKPMLYIHGDGHSWIQDNPFTPNNVTRVQVDRGDEPPVAVTVDLSGQFAFERDPWPNGTPLLNRAPCVDAGSDTTLGGPGVANLDGVATDDGVPNDPPSLTVDWLQIAGPPGASIADPMTASTTVTLSAAGTYVFELSADDGALARADTMQVVVGGAPGNLPPVALADTFVTAADTPITVPAPGVLANDSDPDGDPVTAVLETSALHGALDLQADGSFTYTPDVAFAGTDSFRYRAHDGSIPSAPATVTLSVVSNLLTLLPTDDARVNAGSPDQNYGSSSELRVEADGSPDLSYLKFTVSGAGSIVAATLRLRVTNPSDDGGSVHLVSNDYDGTTTPWDEDGLVWNNRPPIVNPALDNAGAVSSQTWIELDVSGAVAGDGVYSFALQNNSSNSVRYSSKEGSFAPELVVQSAPPNVPPSASADAYAVDEDSTLVVAAPGVLANDVDANADSLVASEEQPPVHGALLLAADGGFTYTPVAQFAGVDSFAYRVSDGRGGEDTATVTLTVTGTNDPPLALADTFVVTQGRRLVVGDPGVLLNDVDVDGDTLTALLQTDVTAGTLDLAAMGGFTYDAPPRFVGTETFTYRAHDGIFQSAATTVAVRVVVSEVALAATQSVGASSQASWATSSDLLAVDGALYVAAIACRPPRAVVDVQGLGLAWTPARVQCSAAGDAVVELWSAWGTPVSGPVSVVFDQAPTHGVLHVSRWEGVNPNEPLRVLVSGNAQGVEGGCAGGSPDSSYSFVVTAGSNGGAVVGVLEAGGADASSSFSAVDSVSQSGAGVTTSIHLLSKDAVAGNTSTWSGSFSEAVDWSAIAFEVRPLAPPAGRGRARNVQFTAMPANPVIGQAHVSYRLAEPTEVDVRIYDARGRLVRQLVGGVQAPGLRHVVWDARTDAGLRVGAGVYFVRVRLGSETRQAKVVLVR